MERQRAAAPPLRWSPRLLVPPASAAIQKRRINLPKPFIRPRALGASRLNDWLCLADTLCSRQHRGSGRRTPFLTMAAVARCNEETCSRSSSIVKSFLLAATCVRFSRLRDAASRSASVSLGPIRRLVFKRVSRLAAKSDVINKLS